jgi:ribosomal RNA small subunit methyltransferase B
MNKENINVRAIALDALMLVTDENMFMNKALELALEKYAFLDKKDRALISRLVHGCLEHIISIDYIIDLFSDVKTEKLRPVIRGILRISVYQLLFMDKIPARAVCDEAVKLVAARRLDGLKGFVNGVLRNIDRNKDSIGYVGFSTMYSMPEWIIDIFKKDYEPETVRKILESFLKERPLNIRVNTSKTTKEALIAELQGFGIKVEESNINKDVLLISNFDSISELNCINDGRASIQDASSSLLVELLDIPEDSLVIDVCAAPGGKAIHVADKLRGSGKVYAFDISENKTKLIVENVEKVGFKNIETKVFDARALNQDLVGKADFVIADLPCSGLGVLGGKPDIKLHLTSENVNKLVILQQEILENVCKYVKQGGYLAYSTCTINRAENADNVNKFLENHKDFKQVDLNEKVKHLNGIYKNGLNLQLLPINDCDGFFISIFQKVN